MPITKSAKKAIRVTARRKAVNDRRRKEMKEVIKKVEKTAKDDKAGAKAMLPKAYKAIDKATKGKIIKKNNAARKKSRLSRITK